MSELAYSSAVAIAKKIRQREIFEQGSRGLFPGAR